jgi:hypothetical protein
MHVNGGFSSYLPFQSFYLPGSVDENDKQMDQWNMRTPPLSLWSRRDFTAKHKDIAQKHGHLSKQPEVSSEMEKNHHEDIMHNHPTDDHDHCGDISMLIDDLPTQSDRTEKFRGGAVVTECHKESSPCSNSDRGSLESKGHTKNQPNEASLRKRKHDKEKHGIGMGEISTENKIDGGRPRSLPSVVDGNSSLEGPQSEIPSHAEIGKNQPNETSGRKRNREEQPNVIDGSFSSLEGLQSESREITSQAEIGKKQPNETSVRRRNRDKKRHGKGMGKISPENKMDGGRPRHYTPNVVDGPSSLEGSQSKFREMHSQAEIGEDGHQHFAAAYGGSQASLYDDMGKKYTRRSEELYSSGTHRQLTCVSPVSDYRARDLEERLTSRMRDNSDSLSYRPYITEGEELTRNIEIRSHVRLYGQHDPNLPRSNYLVGHDPRYAQMGSMPSTYGHPGPTADLSYRMNTSAMQRYAPQLDELNHTRPMYTYGSELPMMSRYGFSNRGASQPGFQGSPMGFAPGPHHAYSRHSSAGWLNE